MRKILSLIGLLWCSAAFASDFHSARTAALGGAGHAGPMLNDALYLNPSFVAMLPAYSIGAHYLYYKGQSLCDDCGSGDPHGHGLNASIQDGRSELFQAGLGFTMLDHRKVVSFGASKSVVKRFGAGLGGKWVIPTADGEKAMWDAVFSTVVVPLDWFQVAVVVDNIFQTDRSIAHGLHREFILGTKLNILDIVLLYADPHLAPSAPDSFGHEIGAELPAMHDIFLRAGYFRNAYQPAPNLRGTGFSLGLGWVAPKSSFDVALERVLQPVLCNTFTFGMTVFF